MDLLEKLCRGMGASAHTTGTGKAKKASTWSVEVIPHLSQKRKGSAVWSGVGIAVVQ